ncbi:NAD-dependent glycerol-3-phosphate dehydrogenase N-terminus-domain-containing protein [Cladorrhinum sp. PSN332]|nr:NAD-dependent glycerol-3-phosphate dehydrogenase N-terminus-domain-containing protein [Cladorrhinum sp. PSN332]
MCVRGGGRVREKGPKWKSRSQPAPGCRPGELKPEREQAVRTGPHNDAPWSKNNVVSGKRHSAAEQSGAQQTPSLLHSFFLGGAVPCTTAPPDRDAVFDDITGVLVLAKGTMSHQPHRPGQLGRIGDPGKWKSRSPSVVSNMLRGDFHLTEPGSQWQDKPTSVRGDLTAAADLPAEASRVSCSGSCGRFAVTSSEGGPLSKGRWQFLGYGEEEGGGFPFQVASCLPGTSQPKAPKKSRMENWPSSTEFHKQPCSYTLHRWTTEITPIAHLGGGQAPFPTMMHGLHVGRIPYKQTNIPLAGLLFGLRTAVHYSTNLPPRLPNIHLARGPSRLSKTSPCGPREQTRAHSRSSLPLNNPLNNRRTSPSSPNQPQTTTQPSCCVVQSLGSQTATPRYPFLSIPLLRNYSSTTAKMASNGTQGPRHKIALIGSGNWGTTVGKLMAENTAEHANIFEKDVQMWVYEETVQLEGKPQKLTEVINTKHENVKYLPNIKLPTNLIANPSLVDTVKNATIIVFNLPHEFIGNICKQIKGHILPYARGISCIKGVTVTDDKIELISEYIGEHLSIYCGALSGANIASEIANEDWCETTIAYNTPPCDRHAVNGNGNSNGHAIEEHRDSRGQIVKTPLVPVPREYPELSHDVLRNLFQRPYFTVSMVSDVVGVSLGGALKNIVALACGFVEGHGWNMTAKTAVMRRGMLEIIDFAREFYPETVQEKTLWEESAGWGDMIVSCTSARNWRYSKMAVERGVSIQEIERTELNGQKLQGISTSREVSSFLRARGVEDKYPLFKLVDGILDQTVNLADIPRLFRKAQ